jgi:hypothetical protein
MTVTLLTSPRAAEEIDALTDRELKPVIEMLEFLCENPLGAQTAGFAKMPEVRRAIAESYNMESGLLEILSVRHGKRRPLTARGLRSQPKS